MEKQFRHHPDGWIYINDLVIPLKDFVSKNTEYKLPRGWIGREYIKGEMNRVYSSNNEEFLDKEWKDGDKYIKQYDYWVKYLKKKEQKKT